MRKYLTNAFALAIGLGAAGCTALEQDIDTVLYAGAINIKQANLADLDPGLGHLHEYAAMSALIYKDADVSDDGCTLRHNLGWEPAEEWNTKPRAPSTAPGLLKIDGLEYEVWRRGDADKPERLAIVFRGTDSELGDWYSNLRWITQVIPFPWDQYDQTRAQIPGLLTAIRARYGKDIPIVATGHSLGGGLAQQAGYSTPEISEVYAFDSSSVTGFYSVKSQEERARNSKGMRIYRIHERGEVLAYLRWGMSKIYPIAIKDPQIGELRFDLTKGRPFIEHSMRQLACNLKALAEDRRPTS